MRAGIKPDGEGRPSQQESLASSLDASALAFDESLKRLSLCIGITTENTTSFLDNGERSRTIKKILSKLMTHTQERTGTKNNRKAQLLGELAVTTNDLLRQCDERNAEPSLRHAAAQSLKAFVLLNQEFCNSIATPPPSTLLSTSFPPFEKILDEESLHKIGSEPEKVSLSVWKRAQSKLRRLFIRSRGTRSGSSVPVQKETEERSVSSLNGTVTKVTSIIKESKTFLALRYAPVSTSGAVVAMGYLFYKAPIGALLGYAVAHYCSRYFSSSGRKLPVPTAWNGGGSRLCPDIASISRSQEQDQLLNKLTGKGLVGEVKCMEVSFFRNLMVSEVSIVRRDGSLSSLFDVVDTASETTGQFSELFQKKELPSVQPDTNLPYGDVELSLPLTKNKGNFILPLPMGYTITSLCFYDHEKNIQKEQSSYAVVESIFGGALIKNVPNNPSSVRYILRKDPSFSLTTFEKLPILSSSDTQLHLGYEGESFVQSLWQHYDQPSDRAAALASYLAQKEFIYSGDPLVAKFLTSGKEYLPEAIFGSRVGTCDTFASMNALLFQAIGVSAVRVAGFHCGLNPKMNKYGLDLAIGHAVTGALLPEGVKQFDLTELCGLSLRHLPKMSFFLKRSLLKGSDSAQQVFSRAIQFRSFLKDSICKSPPAIATLSPINTFPESFDTIYAASKLDQNTEELEPSFALLAFKNCLQLLAEVPLSEESALVSLELFDRPLPTKADAEFFDLRLRLARHLAQEVIRYPASKESLLITTSIRNKILKHSIKPQEVTPFLAVLGPGSGQLPSLPSTLQVLDSLSQAMLRYVAQVSTEFKNETKVIGDEIELFISTVDRIIQSNALHHLTSLQRKRISTYCLTLMVHLQETWPQNGQVSSKDLLESLSCLAGLALGKHPEVRAKGLFSFLDETPLWVLTTAQKDRATPLFSLPEAVDQADLCHFLKVQLNTLIEETLRDGNKLQSLDRILSGLSAAGYQQNLLCDTTIFAMVQKQRPLFQLNYGGPEFPASELRIQFPTDLPSRVYATFRVLANYHPGFKLDSYGNSTRWDEGSVVDSLSDVMSLSFTPKAGVSLEVPDYPNLYTVAPCNLPILCEKLFPDLPLLSAAARALQSLERPKSRNVIVERNLRKIAQEYPVQSDRLWQNLLSTVKDTPVSFGHRLRLPDSLYIKTNAVSIYRGLAASLVLSAQAHESEALPEQEFRMGSISPKWLQKTLENIPLGGLDARSTPILSVVGSITKKEYVLGLSFLALESLSSLNSQASMDAVTALRESLNEDDFLPLRRIVACARRNNRDPQHPHCRDGSWLWRDLIESYQPEFRSDPPALENFLSTAAKALESQSQRKGALLNAASGRGRTAPGILSVEYVSPSPSSSAGELRGIVPWDKTAPIKSLDGARTLRKGMIMVREFEDETARPVHCIVDLYALGCEIVQDTTSPFLTAVLSHLASARSSRQPFRLLSTFRGASWSVDFHPHRGASLDDKEKLLTVMARAATAYKVCSFEKKVFQSIPITPNVNAKLLDPERYNILMLDLSQSAMKLHLNMMRSKGILGKILSVQKEKNEDPAKGLPDTE